jgi:hypothetical protein
MFLIYLILAFVAFRGYISLCVFISNKKFARMTHIEREQYFKNELLKINKSQYGSLNKAMICNHCQSKGVRTKSIEQKKGISGAKATANILTGGLLLPVVGLSRKENATQAHCDKCNNTWIF